MTAVGVAYLRLATVGYCRPMFLAVIASVRLWLLLPSFVQERLPLQGEGWVGKEGLVQYADVRDNIRCYALYFLARTSHALLPHGHDLCTAIIQTYGHMTSDSTTGAPTDLGEQGGS